MNEARWFVLSPSDMKSKLSKRLTPFCKFLFCCSYIITCPRSPQKIVALARVGYLNRLILIWKERKAESGGAPAIHPCSSDPALLSLSPTRGAAAQAAKGTSTPEDDQRTAGPLG